MSISMLGRSILRARRTAPRYDVSSSIYNSVGSKHSGGMMGNWRLVLGVSEVGTDSQQWAQEIF